MFKEGKSSLWWASAISDGVIGFTGFGVARVEEFRHPFVFKLFGLA